MILNIKITINMVISFTMEKIKIDLALAKEIVLSLFKMIIVAMIQDEIHPMTIIVDIDLPVATIDTIIIDVIVGLTVVHDISLENPDIKVPTINITIDQ